MSYDLSTIRTYALRWSDLPSGKILVVAYEDKLDDKGKLAGGEYARLIFDPKEASEENKLQAASYGFKKRLQDSAAQIKQGEFTLGDKFASFADTWEVMKTKEWVSKRAGGGAQKFDLNKIAYCLALGRGIELDKVPAIVALLSAKDKEGLKAIMATDEFAEGVLMYDKQVAEAGDLQI